MRQRSFSANKDIQTALQKALEDTIYAMDFYCTLYNIVVDIKYDSNGNADTSKMGRYEVSFEWDDSILVDAESELATRMSLYEKGLESQLELRMWYFGETEAQAQEALNKIAEEKRAAIEQNMMVSSQLGQQVRDGNGQPQEGQKESQEQAMGKQQQQQQQFKQIQQAQENEQQPQSPNNGTQTPQNP